MEVLAGGGRLHAVLLLVGAALLLVASAGGAEAWAHHGAAGARAGAERRYRDLAAGRMESVRSSFGKARRGLATLKRKRFSESRGHIHRPSVVPLEHLFVGAAVANVRFLYG
ncbi:unnamed protein product [Triticum turgidum subsp. durum]|uniref:DDE Tnp4 domain-containing protein n=1 Tax=Triticum turgidum subsp. durum TaxID=4567 RepID=A0A9R1P2V8_TRITD|nr:unnamed protein product [Triticum turgidum subsp. durum]